LYVAFSPDGKLLASGGVHGIIVWDAVTRKEIYSRPEPVDHLVFSRDGKLLAGGGGNSRLWDAATGVERAAIAEPGAMIGFVDNGQTLVTVANQYMEEVEVRFWSAANGERKRTIPLPRIDTAAISPDGARLAISAGWEITLWDTATGQQQAALSTDSICRGLAFTSDGKKLAGGLDNRRVVVWDLTSGQQLGQDVHLDPVRGVAFSPDGTTLATSTIAGDIKLWNMKPPAESESIAVDELSDLRFSEDGRILLVGNGGLAQVIDIPTGKEVALLPLSNITAFSSDGLTAARFSPEDRLQAWNVDSGRELASLAVPASQGERRLAVSADGKRAATFHRWRGDNRLTLWDLASQQAQTLAGSSFSVSCAAFSPDGKLLAAGFQFEFVMVWEVATGKLKLKFAQRPASTEVLAVAFSPDSKSLAVGTDVGAVAVWDVDSGQRIADCRGHTNHVWALAFSPDGSMLATGGNDKTVKLWEARTGQERITLTGHKDQISHIQFAPDGRTLATGSYFERAARLWRTATGPDAWAPHTAPTAQFSSEGELQARRLPACAIALTAAGLREAVRRFPEDLSLRRRLVRALADEGHFEEAESVLAEIVREQPTNEEAYREQVALLRQQQKFSAAEEVARQAIRVNHDQSWPRGMLGWLLLRQEKYPAAEAEFREAIRLKPNQAEGYSGLGSSLRGQKRHEEARVALAEATRLAPNDSAAHTTLGWTLVDLKEYPGAEIEFRTVIRLNPEVTVGHHGLGVAFEGQKRFADAVEPLRKAIRIAPSQHNLHGVLGRVLMAQGLLPEAEAEFREQIRLQAAFAKGHFHLGGALLGQNRHAEAELALREALRLEPGNPEATRLLARALNGQGKTAEAESLSKTAAPGQHPSDRAEKKNDSLM
jgi:WD40 repeat protein/Flp pilus assembly protein TadD